MASADLASLAEMATRLRIHSIESTTAAGSGHPTSCCSMAELTSAIFFHAMRFDPKNPGLGNNDRFVLSKGHAAPILYAAWAEAGLFPTSELASLRKIDSDLEGHPTPRLPFVDVATGSLGQGLSAACGIAYAGKYLDQADFRVYVLMGDGESAEGSVWEAMAFASHYQLDNMVAIFDVNRLGQSEPTMYQHHVDVYRRRAEAFGWHALVLDGHDIKQVVAALDEARTIKDRPTALIAKTFKGHGIPGIEDKDNWHGKPLGDKTAAAIEHLRSRLTGSCSVAIEKPRGKAPASRDQKVTLPALDYVKGKNVATREAYGKALARLGETDDRIIALDADTKNSTFSDKLKAVRPKQHVECFIAEQNMVGVGVGLSARGKIVFCSTFACFLSRAFDQIRMAAISRSKVNLAGSHVGVSIGQDGPSQMGLEDIAFMRTIPGLALFYPSDAVSTERAVELASNHPGMTFIRTSRPAQPVLYDNDEPFEIGKAKIVRSSPKDQVTVVGAGVTLHEALKAATLLEKDGISIRVIDPFTVKPIDSQTLLASALATSGRVLTVEDHYPEGGLGDAVAGALKERRDVSIEHLAVREVPRSGSPEELLARFGIDAQAIVSKVKSMLNAQ